MHRPIPKKSAADKVLPIIMMILGFGPLIAVLTEISIEVKGYLPLIALMVFLPVFFLSQHRAKAFNIEREKVMTANVMADNPEVSSVIWTGSDEDSFRCILAYRDGTVEDHLVQFDPKAGKPNVQ